jgi:hypothetical protein
MLFIEFIAPIKGSARREECLCALYYLKHNLGSEISKVSQIKNLLEQSRVVKKGIKINYARVLDSLNELVDSPVIGMWQITPSGEKYVRSIMKIPESNLESENDTTTLVEIIQSKIKDSLIADYFKEGVDCLEIGRLRACVIFLWTGSISIIRTRLISQNQNKLNVAIKKHDFKARDIKNIDDFAYIKDSTLLLVLKELNLCDKSQKEILEECLNLRNKCGHPAKYSPGPKRISAFIEDLVSVLFDK